MEHPISQRIKIIIERESKGKVVDFANKLNDIPYQVISRLFKCDARNGKYPTPSTDVLLEIINKFTSYNPVWLITGKGEMLLEQNKNDNVFAAEVIESFKRTDIKENDIYWRGRYDELLEQYERLLNKIENKLIKK